jgi:hypothetical protein
MRRKDQTGSGALPFTTAAPILFLAIFIAMGWVPILQAARRGLRNRDLVQSGWRTTGTVIDYRRSSGKNARIWPVVRFSTPQGASVTFESLYHPPYTGYIPGQRVPVVYDPNDPRRAEIDDPERLWGGLGVSCLVGAAFITFGCGGILFVLRRRNQVPG